MDLGEIVTVGLGLGLMTMVFRLGFGELWSMPDRARSIIAWVPVAALGAIVAPALVPEQGDGSMLPTLIATIVAGGVAYRTRNLLWSVGLGMAAYWLVAL